MKNTQAWRFESPTSTAGAFEDLLGQLCPQYAQNRLCRALEASEATLVLYQSLLVSLFHQTFWSSSSFALAGAALPAHRHPAKEYLFKHAEEEKSHWQWTLNDLLANGYAGPDVTSSYPRPACQAYISFNLHIAQTRPMARLGIAAMLESLGASYGKKYATLLCQQLKLRPEQASFFFGHGDTDIGHTQEIITVLNAAQLSPIEWGEAAFAAQTAFVLYNRMYDEAAQSAEKPDFGLKV